MVLYLIKVNDLYYGKENSPNGRILRVETTNDSLLPYIVKEIAYKTKAAAIKGAEKIKKEKQNANITIQALIFKD